MTLPRPFLAVVLAAWPLLSAADATDEVRCAEIRFSLAAEQHNPAAFEAAIDPDARFVGGEVEHGPAAVMQAWAPFFEPDGPRIAWRPRFVEVLASGDLALTRGPYRLETKGKDGQAVVRWGTFNSVWRRQPDGGWQVVFDAGAAPTETATAENEALLAAPTNCGSPASAPGASPAAS
jgi:ketosteroid isomerase-like protein